MLRLLITVLIILYPDVVFCQPVNFNKPVQQAGIINKKRVAAIKGKPVAFYLAHPKIDSESKRFYKGEIALKSDLGNCTFLDSLYTDNSETRPFYFFILNTIIDLSANPGDEKLSDNCLLYIEKFPCEFFGDLDNPGTEINVVKWTNYVGLRMSNPQIHVRFRNAVDQKLTSCSQYSDLWRSFYSEARKCIIR